ncbi:hypothetical protein [Pedosphaera parvula]|uniref:Uncharacterized protein n=1 Tax=Pedosphaera parvula (strain Ellin514) TaxID=320771 RepID=B9XC56_PEDPL|nr:hypothetical protein [Pedosphaera parvula]EEF62524.1 hypothetical protein Cflav_PD5159 [Pedosphaera parvula Ellin514]
MESAEAREILRLYRPGSTDATDPKVAEALELVRRDPELEQWFEQHCAVYQAVQGKLKEIPVPANLKRDILLNAPKASRILPFRNPPLILLAMAAIAMAIGICWTLLVPKYQNTFPGFRDKMARTAQRGYNMSMLSTNLTEIREYLRNNHANADYALTKTMEKLPGEGCSILHWHGKQVSMVCLKTLGKKDLFLFVANRDNLPNLPLPGKIQFSRVHKLMTASWISGGEVYVLASPGDETELRQYLD